MGRDVVRRGDCFFLVLMVSMILTIVAALIFLVSSRSFARDNGQFGDSSPERREWFKSLHSGMGPCCSDADGNTLTDNDWKVEKGHYVVRIGGDWIDVPDVALIKEPNKYGRTIVWPFYKDGHLIIRCFIPGTMG